MFDLLRPITKLAYITAFIALFIAANAMLLYVLSSCLTSAACIGTGGAEVATSVRTAAGLFLPGNFFACIQFMITGEIARRAYDFAMKVADVSAKAS